MSRRARLIVNPAARRPPSRDRLATASAWLRLHGWEVDVCRTEGAGHATHLAREAAAGEYDAVIAVGGDGTINEAVNGLAATRTALAVIPAGTANVWVRETGSPAHPGAVAALLERGERIRVDLGIAGGRYFLLMASLGVDSAVVATMPAAPKARYGRMAYAAQGLRDAVRYRGVRAEIAAEGETWRLPLLLALLGNTRSYGGVLRISHRASATDGRLDLVLYRAGGAGRFTSLLARTLAGRHEGASGAVYRQVSEVHIRTDPAVPVQADGEIIGETPMVFEVAPSALTVILPKGGPHPLFERPAMSPA